MATGKGYKVENSWVVELDDNTWHKSEGQLRELLLNEIKDEARTEGCTSIVVFAIPDPIFPMYGYSSKKRVHFERIALSEAPQYSIKTTYRAEILSDTWERTPEHLRDRLVRKVRDDINLLGLVHPGYYQILLCLGEECKLLERGRV